MVKKIAASEVARHNGPKSLWMIIDNDVYDVTNFQNEHPGGAQTLLEFAGKNATNAFENVGHSDDARNMMKKYKIGTLPPEQKSSYHKDCIKSKDDRKKSEIAVFQTEFWVYQISECKDPETPPSEKTWRTFDGAQQSRSKSPTKPGSPKPSVVVTPAIQAVVVPRETGPRKQRRQPPSGGSSKLKWALLALAGALVIGFVMKKKFAS